MSNKKERKHEKDKRLSLHRRMSTWPKSSETNRKKRT